jgi:uncharacterized radical SAM superfamily Fe-S cluster-containing enzyme
MGTPRPTPRHGLLPDVLALANRTVPLACTDRLTQIGLSVTLVPAVEHGVKEHEIEKIVALNAGRFVIFHLL